MNLKFLIFLKFSLIKKFIKFLKIFVEKKIKLIEIKAFASAYAKISIYFNIRTYFFLFYLTTFKTSSSNYLFFTRHFII